MRCFDYDSHVILELIRHDFITEANWTIEPYFNSSNHKCVRLIWHPSTLVYNYLVLRQQKIESLFDGMIFRLYRMNQNGYGSGWRQKIDVSYGQESFTINWLPRYYTTTGQGQLSSSRVNNQITGLTAQLVHISLRIPYWDGISRHTKGARRWQAGYGAPAYNSNTLYWKTLSLRCFVSSDRGIYQRNDDGNIVPLTCSNGISPGFYKKHNRGLSRFTVHKNNDASHIIYSFNARTWKQYVIRQTTHWDWSINSSHQVLWRNTILLDGSTKLPVLDSDYVIPDHVYIPMKID